MEKVLMALAIGGIELIIITMGIFGILWSIRKLIELGRTRGE